MKKLCMVTLAALILLWPAAVSAQGLPDFLSAVYDGIGEGLEAGMSQALASVDQELTLDVVPSQGRLEEGKTITLTVTAGNPRPQETKVQIELKLPERVAAAQDTTWEAVLEPAKLDAETGAFVPSVTVFTREITLTPGGKSEQTAIGAEMSMGTRFYRASAPLDLCVADISANASAEGMTDGRLRPGDAFTYQIEVLNAGMAPKDVQVELILPDSVELGGELPGGFARVGSRISGQIRAEAAQLDEAGAAASRAVITLPASISEQALDGDEDATRLLAGILRVDGERVPLPRIQVCGARISARLLADADSLEAGEEMKLRVVLVNAGLADADVRVSCVLPDGLTLVTGKEADAKEGAKTDNGEDADEQKEDKAAGETEDDAEIATPAQASLPPEDWGTPDAAVEIADEAEAAEPAMRQENNTLIYDVHMDAASETDGGVTASTRVLEMQVKAEESLENVKERLVGATLAWTVDDGQAQLGEAVAMRVYSPGFLGIGSEEWSGIFWASLLLVVTVACLYAAVRADNSKDEFLCE